MSDHSSNNSDSSYESDSDTSSDENNNNYDECGCINSILDLKEHLKNQDKVIKILQTHHLIKLSHNGKRCGKETVLDTVNLNWRCQKNTAVGKKGRKGAIPVGQHGKVGGLIMPNWISVKPSFSATCTWMSGTRLNMPKEN